MRQWYIIAYDVSNARRLKKLHYFLSKKALALQNSVFLAKLDKASLDKLLEGLGERSKSAEDDIRLYPVVHPDMIWVAGKQAEAIDGLYGGSANKEPSPAKRWFGTLLGRREQ